MHVAHRVEQFCHLLLSCTNHCGICMTSRGHTERAGEIEILVALCVPDVAALALGQDAGAALGQRRIVVERMQVMGGVELLKFTNVQVLANASAPLRDDIEAGWTLAVGFDAVQFARFSANAGARLLREHPLREDR